MHKTSSDKTVFASKHLQPFRLFLCLANLGGPNVNRFDAKKVIKDFVLGATHAAADWHLKDSPLLTEARIEKICMSFQRVYTPAG